jgi:sugar lactone lactonase YvrE
MALKVEIAVEIGAQLGEGAYWDPAKKVLYWVDIESKRLYIFEPRTRENRSFEIGEKIGTVVPKKSGGLVLALENSLAEFFPETGALKTLMPLEADIPENRSNDGKCDPAGRFWVGSMAPEEKPGGANLYRIEKDYSVSRVLSEVTISNGLVWSHDKRRMYYIDTPTRRVSVFDYRLETGEISHRRLCIELPPGRGLPDGMTIDEEGMLWIAMFGGWGVSRWNPENGKMLDYFEMPAKNITSCSFGGEHLDELYVTSARTLNTENELADQPEAGNLFRLEPGVRGVPLSAFGG